MTANGIIVCVCLGSNYLFIIPNTATVVVVRTTPLMGSDEQAISHTGISGCGSFLWWCGMQVDGYGVYPEDCVQITSCQHRPCKWSEIQSFPSVFHLLERTISPRFWTILSVWNTMLLEGFYSTNSNQTAGTFQWQKRTRKNMSGIAEQTHILQWQEGSERVVFFIWWNGWYWVFQREIAES